MSLILRLSIFLILQVQFFACYIPHDPEIICQDNLKKATELVDRNTDNLAALDSALIIVERCMKCNSIKKAAVDLKIRVLHNVSKFREGSQFVNSLQNADFEYPYKKDLIYNNFIALSLASNKDTVGRNKIFITMADNLTKYINSHNLEAKGFQEAYLDLYSLKANFIDSVVINREIDSLKIKYPDKAKFFNYLKK